MKSSAIRLIQSPRRDFFRGSLISGAQILLQAGVAMASSSRRVIARLPSPGPECFVLLSATGWSFAVHSPAT